MHGEIVRPGKDEMNLIGYPFAVLSQKESKNTVIDLHWNTTHPLSGKIVPVSWMVTGTTAFGLPTTTDERVYRAQEKERTHWCYSNSRASRVLPRRSCIFRALRFD